MKPTVSILLTLVLFGAGWSIARREPGSSVAPITVAPKGVLPTVPTPPPEAVESKAPVGEAGALVENLLARMRSASSATETNMQLFELARTFRSEDFPDAIVSTLRSTQKDARESSVMLAAYWAERDLDAARKWLMNLPSNMQMTFVDSTGGAWARQDAEGFLDWLDSLPAVQRTRIASTMSVTLAASAGEKEPARVAQLLLTLPSDNSTAEFTRLFRGWASMDAVAAAKYAVEMPPGAARSAAAEAAAREWTRRDPAAARAWAQNLPDAVLATRVMPSIAFGLAEKDPKAAAEYVQQTPGAIDSQFIINRVASSWAERDPEQTLRWADTLGTPEAQRWAGRAAIERLAARDPERAAAAYVQRAASLSGGGVDAAMQQNGEIAIAHGLFAKGGIDAVVKFTRQLPAGSGQMALYSAFSQWSTTDTDALAAWAVKQPEDDSRASALALASERMAARNPKAAVDWARNLPAGESRDAALATAAGALLRQDSAAAEQILQGIPGEQAQSNAMSAAMMWMFEDPTKARAWIEKTPLFGDDVRRSLLEAKLPQFRR